MDDRASADLNDDWCYINGLYDSHTLVELIDHNDPTVGVQVSYFGDICHSTGKKRQFKIMMTCQDRMNPIPTHALEYETCVYSISIPSIYGCPLECPVGGSQRQLCGGNGFCAYDNDKSAARCFCNSGMFSLIMIKF